MIETRKITPERLTDVPERKFETIDVPEPQRPKPNMWKRALKFIAKQITRPKVNHNVYRNEDEVIFVVRVAFMGIDLAVFATVDTGLDGDQAGVELRVLFEQREIYKISHDV